MKKPVIGAIFIITLICALAGCSMPIGTIYGVNSEVDSNENSMFLIPRRILYEIEDRFMRNEDFQLFMVNNGVTSEIPTYTQGVSITLSGNYGLTSEFHDPVTTTHHQLMRVGRHIVEVEYNDRKANYSLQVTSSSNGAGLGGDGGIGIIWLE